MKMKTNELINKLIEIGPVFTINDASKYLKMDKHRLEYHLRRLVRENVLKNPKRGVYVFVDKEPYYYAKLIKNTTSVVEKFILWTTPTISNTIKKIKKK